MKKVLVAGSTGYLGQYVVKELKKQGYWVRALARDPKKLDAIDGPIDDIFVGEVTMPDTLTAVCDGIDVVFSCVGITRQKDGLSYHAVDYQGNKNLLDQAIKSGVSKFIYVSALNDEKMGRIKAIEAKLDFVKELKSSGMDYAIICPSAFFSDMREFLNMAKSGIAFLLGEGQTKINPIDGADLAEVCVSAIEGEEKEIEVGGPEIFTNRQMLEMSFHALGKEPNIISIPLWVGDAASGVLKLFAPENIYSAVEFAVAALGMDMVGKPYGKKHLADFFKEEAEKTTWF